MEDIRFSTTSRAEVSREDVEEILTQHLHSKGLVPKGASVKFDWDTSGGGLLGVRVTATTTTRARNEIHVGATDVGFTTPPGRA